MAAAHACASVTAAQHILSEASLIHTDCLSNCQTANDVGCTMRRTLQNHFVGLPRGAKVAVRLTTADLSMSAVSSAPQACKQMVQGHL